MSRIKTSVRFIAAALMSVMLLTGMSCGAGGFSIPLVEPTDERPAGDDPWQAGEERNEEVASHGER